MASLGEEAVRKLTVSGYSRPAPYGSAAAVINNGAGRERVNLGKFGVELRTSCSSQVGELNR